MFDFLDAKTLLTIAHLFGVALGVGGAIASDFMFLRAIRDERVSKTEMGFLELGGGMVLGGLVLLVLSGIGLFSLDPEGYLASSKFLAKMTIVGILSINAVFFHTTHIPRIKRHTDHHFPSSDEFIRGRFFLLLSGVVSIISWSAALILGAIRTIPYPYYTIMGVYLFFLACGVIIATLGRDYFIPHHNQERTER